MYKCVGMLRKYAKITQKIVSEFKLKSNTPIRDTRNIIFGMHIVIREKRKKSESVLWQKPLYQQNCQKSKVTTQTTTIKSSITQRLRTDLENPFKWSKGRWNSTFDRSLCTLLNHFGIYCIRRGNSCFTDKEKVSMVSYSTHKSWFHRWRYW